ncbi:hypothetical protein MHLP_03370 [Candidatus Mycoplasma haematolamae str. Purdue]|uniref:Uncharacterized protein n=1 Tax=Mycoplasma haematolamae (strain Purdue) TaxID=1212765 RepID=I7CK43_MYCHA|nr:hypothetical protein [Candidatus Mycoplasma haematolamae]AFO52254.1 hypothetical protein MHLP_03370 [Candidatus Mycoplasma haematolamae str. Purdue]
MFLTTKVQIGAALVGLGGANAAAITVFNEPIKDLFLTQNSLDLPGVNNQQASSHSLKLHSRSRRGLQASTVSGNLEAPNLELSAESSGLELEALQEGGAQTIDLGSQISAFREELGKQDQMVSLMKQNKEKVSEIRKKLELHKSALDTAIEKIRTFVSKNPSEKVKGLTKQERIALGQAYKTWLDIQAARRETEDQLSKLGQPSRRQKRSLSEQEQKGESLLANIGWTWDAIRFLGKDYDAGGQVNRGFEFDWDKNPWKPFFSDKTEWEKTWSERDAIKGELFKSYVDALNDWWTGDQCNVLQSISGDSRQYCIVEMANRGGRVFGEANIKIELLVGQKLLEWMNIPLTLESR